MMDHYLSHGMLRRSKILTKIAALYDCCIFAPYCSRRIQSGSSTVASFPSHPPGGAGQLQIPFSTSLPSSLKCNQIGVISCDKDKM